MITGYVQSPNHPPSRTRQSEHFWYESGSENLTMADTLPLPVVAPAPRLYTHMGYSEIVRTVVPIPLCHKWIATLRKFFRCSEVGSRDHASRRPGAREPSKRFAAHENFAITADTADIKTVGQTKQRNSTEVGDGDVVQTPGKSVYSQL